MVEHWEIDLMLLIVLMQNYITQEQWQDIMHRYGHYDTFDTKAAQQDAQNFANEFGFDSIDYLNRGEGPGTVSTAVVLPNQIKSAAPVTYFKANDPEVLSGQFKAGDVIPLSMRDDFSRSDIRFNTNDIYSTILGKMQPFDFDAIYNKMRQVELNAIEQATKEGFNTAEQDIMSYLGSEKHIQQIMKSGQPREVAERVAQQMKQNADNSNVSFDWLPSTEGGEHRVKFNTEYEQNPNKETIWQKIFGGYKKYINPKEVLTNEVTINNSIPRNSDDFRSVINHEVGGHSADLGVNPKASYFNSPHY